jgi:putative redox protein
MKSEKISFTGSLGEQLAGVIDWPEGERADAFGLFAHCFTCSKDLRASANVSRALAAQGYGVLRFDFTGLGHSEGDFADSNFASNIDDLVAASEFLAAKHEAPRLLIGHSLGGAAVVHAAQRIPSAKAVATIGAPFDPEHVTHLLADKVDTIQEEGEAAVTIGGRPFTIRKEFLETLQRDNLADTVRMMRKALLILHSPIDATVGVENAQRLFEAAVHPKSFVSLDKADHLLQKKADAEYAGRVIATWAQKYTHPAA